ncbi:hypothetical protein [Aliarcobacter butzleri]|uniref:hypothetical protein n=1 Tax=Aliarcobacter butzleri TaxID=28197 RepID=UPI003AF4823B
MDFDKMIEKMQFGLIGQELEYLGTTIEKLITNYQKDFQDEDDKYKQSIEELKQSGEYYEPLDEEHAPGVTYGQMMEYNLREPFFELESFSSIIIESLIIKHVAYIEDILIKISFMVQKNEKQVIPPDHNITGHFTDMLKAVDYIKLVTNNEIKIRDTRNWKMITLLRTLRHELAHGNRSFVLKEGVIDDINKEAPLINKGMIILKNFDHTQGLAQYGIEAGQQPKDPKNEWNCSICSNINVLKKINEICIDFIDEVKSIYTQKYDIQR